MEPWAVMVVCLLGTGVMLACQPMTGNHRAAIEPAEVFHRQAPGVAWQDTSRLVIDINDDGQEDHVMIGRMGDVVAIGILLGPPTDHPAWYLFRFSVDSGKQDGLAGPDVSLETTSLDDNPADVFGPDGVPTGYRRSTSARSFSLNDGLSDAFHFYWDHERGCPTWWRL